MQPRISWKTLTRSSFYFNKLHTEDNDHRMISFTFLGALLSDAVPAAVTIAKDGDA